MAAIQTTRWRWISGLLGVLCLALTIMLGILLYHKFSANKQEFQPTTTQVPTLGPQEDCCFCEQKWVGYKCNCYFISSTTKTWSESVDFCASQNSSLLQMHTENELFFMRSSKHFYWIGAYYSKDSGAWLWRNGSAVSENLFPFFKGLNKNKCVMYSPSDRALDEFCNKENRYICKKPSYLGVG